MKREELEILMTGYMLGLSCVEHTEVLEHDPLLRAKLDLGKLPHESNLYRVLDRFDTEEKVEELG